eukprot:364938-Chlamydomonas_euryale.AAC.17
MSEANFVLGGIEQADTVILGVPSDVPYPDCDACILSAMAQGWYGGAGPCLAIKTLAALGTTYRHAAPHTC